MLTRSKVSHSGVSGVEARLGDLDLKSPAKAEYWKNLEARLINEGWYTNLGNVSVELGPSCFLETLS